jgi:peptidyl-prolyl cis-trans isomerase D
MLTAIRKVARGWVAIVFIGVIAAAFAMWGINDVFRPVATNNVAQGQGVAVTANEFAALFDRSVERMREQQPGLTRTAMVEAGRHKQLLDGLIAQKSLQRLAGRLGIAVSNADVAREIQNEAAFRDPITGQFSIDSYRERLATNKFSEAEYEESIRSDMQINQLIAPTLAGVKAPASFNLFLLNFAEEQRKFSLAEIAPAKAGPPPKPSEDDLKKFYDEVKAQFPVPEVRKLTVVIADPADFAAKVQVPEDEIVKLYNFRREKLRKPESRSFVQIVAPNESAARDAAARLAKGEPADLVAKAVGAQPPLTFKDTALAAVPDQTIAKAVFAMAKPGATALQGNTWSAARLDTITPAVEPSLDSLRAELRQELAKDQAEEALTTAAEAYDEALAGGAPVEQAAQTAGLRLLVLPSVTRDGRTSEGAPVELIGAEKEVLDAAFEAPQDEPTDFIPLANGSSIKVRIDAITPATTRSFAELRTGLAQEWTARKVNEALLAVAKKIEADVKAGKSFEDAVKAQGLAVNVKGASVPKGAALMSPMASLFTGIFGAAKGAVVTAASPVGTLAVAHVDEIILVDAKTAGDRIAAQGEQATALLSENLVLALQNSAIEAAKFKKNDAKINQTIGVAPPTADGAPAK